MTPEELAEKIISEQLPLLEISKVLGTNEAYTRGSSMLSAQGALTHVWKELADKLVIARSQEQVAYHQAVSSAEGKDAEARKAAAKANLGYIKAREEVELLENNVAYIQSFNRQFDAAFRLFSYMIKGGEGQI